MKEGQNKAAEMPQLRNKLYDVHKEMVEAISEQERQMQVPAPFCASCFSYPTAILLLSFLSCLPLY